MLFIILPAMQIECLRSAHLNSGVMPHALIAMKVRCEADEWSPDGRKILSANNLEIIRKTLEDEGTIILEHWHLTARSHACQSSLLLRGVNADRVPQLKRSVLP